MILLWYIVLIITSAICAKDIPDITLLSQNNNNDSIVSHICVAGHNVEGSAISFITPLRSTYMNDTPESQYVSEGQEYLKDEYNCNFEKGSSCINEWTGTVEQAGQVANAPEIVLDERWESNEIHNAVKHTLNSDNINVGISIRTGGNTTVLLCNESKMKCYSIAIEKKKLTLRICDAVNDIANFKAENSGCTDIPSKTTINIIISEKNWNHYYLSKLNSDKLKICDSRKNVGCTEYELSNDFSTKSMYIYLNQKGIWKIHNYSYLSLKQEKINDEWQDLGPVLKSVPGDTLCLALYAATCKECSLSFRLANEDTPKRFKNLQEWKYIKLTLSNVQNMTDYKLQVKAKVLSNTTGFWLIDDVRRCHLHETRIIKTSTPMTETSIVSCVPLKNNTWSSTNTGGKVGTPVNKICDDIKYIGQNCNISCTSVLGNNTNNQYCNKHIICKSVINKISACSCAAGYYGEQCINECSQGFYGYNCHKVCEPCKTNCLKSSGVCPPRNTCNPDDKDEGCQRTEILKLLAPPDIINSTLTTITVQPKINGRTTNLNEKYQIQYKTDSIIDWITYEEKEEKRKISTLEITTLSNLTPLTQYRVRVVLFTEDEMHNTSIYEQIFTPVLTDCKNITSGIKNYTNLNILPNLDSVYITWTPVCNGILKFTPIIKENLWACDEPSSLSTPINITDGNYTLNNLISSTNYTLNIQVIDDDLDTDNQLEKISISTAESDLPVLKSRPKIISTTLTTITVQFNRKEIKNGDSADSFILEYRQSSEDWKRTTKTKLNASNEVIIEKDLEMEKSYYIRVVFYKKDDYYDSCIPTANATTTCTDSSVFPLVKNLSVEPKKNEAIVRWTPVCKNNFKIKIKCGRNPWCTKIDEIPSFSSLNTNQTITNLIPYTYYSIEFMATDQQKNEMQTMEFQTKPAAPPPVKDLKVYSFDTDVISVRFKKPNPPHGKLQYYEQCYFKCDLQKAEMCYKNESVNCELWDGYQCLTLSPKQNNKFNCYNITIVAINENVKERGSVSYTNTIEKDTEAPRNLNVNKLKVCWDHPNFTKGTLTEFEITIKQTETILFMSENFNSSSINYPINKLQKNYCHQIDENLPPSSKFKILIKGINKNGVLGKEAKIEIFSLPIQPMLVGNIIGNKRTNDTQEITIPAFNETTLTNKSSMYVVVCDPQLAEETSSNLKDVTGCNGTFWIASKLNASQKEQLIIVGNNEPLRPDVNYIISVLLVNEYNNQTSYGKYFIITSAPVQPPDDDNPALYALLLLLLIIPITGYFAYRKFLKQEILPQSGTSFEEVPVQNNNVPMRNIFNNTSRNIPNRKNEQLQTEHEEPLINEDRFSYEPAYTKLVKIGNLSQYVKGSLENGELAEQHELFPKGGTKPWKYGMAKENKFKNRYNNLTAYDHSRVVLNKLHGDPFSDFINANYIDGYKKPKAYIATQGPKPSTLNDFWRMIWQENVKYIVMLANLIEGNKPKCEQYWPELGSTQEYYNVSVKYVQTDICADFEYRSFEATCDGQTRKIQHLHFTSWPDHGVPQYPQSLVPFLRKILTIPTTAPIVVHCSAGVGRTGTIILADICLRMAASEGQVDVLKYMHSIREQRAKLVDNFDQYKLVHMVLLECLLAPETSLPCENLAKSVNDLIQQGGLQTQIAYLKDTAWHNQIMKSPINIEPENVSKNRFPDIVPSVRRLYISRYPYEDEYSDYINAVPVDGFRNKDQFIVTQTPLPHTVKDFWRMIIENNVKVIVSLNEIIINDKSCCLFWPLENGQYSPVPYLTLNYLSVKEGANYDTYNIQLVNTSSSEKSVTTVSIIQYKNWKREHIVPDDAYVLIRVLEEAQNLSRQGDPQVITCHDGSTASGLFVALSFLIEKMKLEQICDVCQAVRSIRLNRPQFMSYRKQFEFLYQAAVHYVASFDDYSNFEVPQKS